MRKNILLTVNKPVDREFVRRMSKGVPVLDTVTRPCRVVQTGECSFRIILTQGLNRQIRRMCRYLGYEVQKLKRIRIMNLTLDGIREGEYREITAQEWEELNHLLESSTSETVIRTGEQNGNSSDHANERAGAKAGQGQQKAYYQQDTEIISNREYDQMYDELQALEKETGTVLANSPTVSVGYEAVDQLPKEEHESPMLSLDKTKDREVLREFIGEHKTLLSWKLDGLTIVLTYENGELAKAVTRGNGVTGEVVTNNARVFKNVPLKIRIKEDWCCVGKRSLPIRTLNGSMNP